MKVVLIKKFYGYCPGLRRSLKIGFDLAEKALTEKKRIFFDVPLAHNESVEKKLASHGYVQEELSENSDGKGEYFLISAHGASGKKVKWLSDHHYHVVEATCPTVTKLLNQAVADHKAGYQIVIFGKAGHPEVVGVNGSIDDSALIFKSIDEAKEIKLTGKASILSQTTFPSAEFEEAIEIIQQNNPDLEIVKRRTICPVVESRVKMISDFARTEKPDMAVVVGSAKSSNTKQLLDKLSEITPSRLIGDETEIKSRDFLNVQSVLVISGTSAPPEIVEAVAEKLKQVGSSKE